MSKVDGMRKIILDDSRIPRAWYNVVADMPARPLPTLHPATGKPLQPGELSSLLATELAEQEFSTQAEIPIPDAVRERLAIWRPTPLVRAVGLERALGAPVKIFYKNESVSPPGSHKANTAVAQAYYAAREGIARLTTETGAGQWGSALSYACSQFDLQCKVFMVRASFDQKPHRRTMMELWGGRCVPSPSSETEVGRALLQQFPDTPGSLGMAISEAVEEAMADPHTKYALGSLLNHVLLHQTVIGLEAHEQLQLVGLRPDVVVGCVGGGSNFGGLALPFVRDKIAGAQIRIVAVEPKSCPTLTRGEFTYDYGDTSKMTPLLPMHTLGHDFVPQAIHAGGLRYHGMAPIVSQLVRDQLVEPAAIDQLESFAAGQLFATTEGYIPAPETCHAIAAAIREARRAKEEGRERTILISWSGHGLMDLAAYDAFLSGRLQVHELADDDLKAALGRLATLPKV